MKLRLETAAMDALTVRLFDAIDESNMAWIMAADEALRRAFDHALIDLIPSYTTLLVHYDCQKLTFAQATTLVRSALSAQTETAAGSRSFVLAVFFGLRDVSPPGDSPPAESL